MDVNFLYGTSELPSQINDGSVYFQVNNSETSNKIFVDYQGVRNTFGLNNLELTGNYANYKVSVGIEKISDNLPLISFTYSDPSVEQYGESKYFIELAPDIRSGISFTYLTPDNSRVLTRINIGTPTEDNHAATKKYVDDAVASVNPVGDVSYSLIDVSDLMSSNGLLYQDNKIIAETAGVIPYIFWFDGDAGLYLFEFSWGHTNPLMTGFKQTLFLDGSKTIVSIPYYNASYTDIVINADTATFTAKLYKIVQTPIALADVNVATKEELANAINGSWEASY